MRWAQFERAAPELAAAARASLAATRLALLGTLRSDGSPRISPIEPYFTDGELLIGAMAWSRKAVDLSDDARVTLHNVLTGPDGGEPEIKLYGRALPADPASRAACANAWWAGTDGAEALVFTIDVTEALRVEWNLGAGELTATSWSPPAGVRVRRRPYP